MLGGIEKSFGYVYLDAKINCTLPETLWNSTIVYDNYHYAKQHQGGLYSKYCNENKYHNGLFPYYFEFTEKICK